MYVTVNFLLELLIFVFPLFLCMVMYAKKFQRKKRKINLNRKLKPHVSAEANLNLLCCSLL